MARYPLSTFIAACIVTLAVSIQLRRNMQHKKNVRRQHSPEIICDGGNTFITPSQMCDGYQDCINGWDEALDGSFSCEGIGDLKIICDTGSTLIPTTYMCDGVNICGDGFDELHCNKFTCNDETTIPSYWECDGMVDCGDGEDEVHCSEFTCNDETTIPSYWECDGMVDCGDGEDEVHCSGYTGSPNGPGPGSTTFDNCQCTCSSPEIYWKKSIKATGLKTLTNGNQKKEKEQQEPKPQFMKKSHKTKNYLEHLLRAMKAKQIRKEQK